jgi:hypothetical protein
MSFPGSGGYKSTTKNRDLLRRYKRGESIGFTARSSLRAKGLLPRVSRKYAGLLVLGPKYSPTGKDYVIGPSRSQTRRRRRGRQVAATRAL